MDKYLFVSLFVSKECSKTDRFDLLITTMGTERSRSSIVVICVIHFVLYVSFPFASMMLPISTNMLSFQNKELV